ncbi:hypothetical protein ACQPW1_22200 [Nocardia sp. CA-128927]|uniref:hypothetical protein n=1 Tax=Nocardia sp. CA-128927 TaxID=3239975 RepID=UPI003D989139
MATAVWRMAGPMLAGMAAGVCVVGVGVGTASAHALEYVGKSAPPPPAVRQDTEAQQEAFTARYAEALKFFCQKTPRSAAFYAEWDAAEHITPWELKPGKDPVREARNYVADQGGKLNDSSRDAICADKSKYGNAIVKFTKEYSTGLKSEYRNDTALRDLYGSKAQALEKAVQKETNSKK